MNGGRSLVSYPRSTGSIPVTAIEIERGVEQFSVLRALSAIVEADICLLVMEYPEVSVQLDQKIGSMISEAGKGLILVVSKWDGDEAQPTAMKQVAALISRDFAFSIAILVSVSGMLISAIIPPSKRETNRCSNVGIARG